MSDNGEFKWEKEIAAMSDPEGRYVDVFRIGHNIYRYILDFGQMESKEQIPIFTTRVIMDPDTARHFLTMIQRSINEYEEQFGQINRKP